MDSAKKEDKESFEVNELIATLEVIDDTLAGETTGRTFVVNFDNFANSAFSSSPI